MKKIEVYQVDSFTGQPFKGNPAGICVLPESINDNLMQSIALEMNLSETAFCVPFEGKSANDSEEFDLRWFTPTVEVALCGHATLATAKVLFDEYHNKNGTLHFFTKSGELVVEKSGDNLVMDFPSDPVTEEKIPPEVLQALGIENALHTAFSRNLNMKLIEVEGAEIVMNLSPNFGELLKLGESYPNGGFLVTSRWGEKVYDIISRFFAPVYGIDEDPVTGAAHTVLGPYWSKKLKKNEIMSFQASARGGEVRVMVKAERVNLIGQAVVVLRGEMTVS